MLRIDSLEVPHIARYGKTGLIGLRVLAVAATVSAAYAIARAPRTGNADIDAGNDS